MSLRRRGVFQESYYQNSLYYKTVNVCFILSTSNLEKCRKASLLAILKTYFQLFFMEIIIWDTVGWFSTSCSSSSLCINRHNRTEKSLWGAVVSFMAGQRLPSTDNLKNTVLAQSYLFSLDVRVASLHYRLQNKITRSIKMTLHFSVFS